MSIFQKNSGMISYNISFAGAGKVAGALCGKLHASGFTIKKIVSPTEERGLSLARSCNASWSNVPEFNDDTDIIIVAVPDHNLKEVLSSIKCDSETIVVHTSGTTGLDVFPENFKRKGVFYPLQTFSPGRILNFDGLPFFIESPDQNVCNTLNNIIISIGGSVYFADSEHRRLIHLAAVFICNFTNHMLTSGKEIAFTAGFSFEIFKPLLNETISKAVELSPENAQTGPAVRNDLNTIEKHLDLLSFSPGLKNVYREITNSILGYHNKNSING